MKMRVVIAALLLCGSTITSAANTFDHLQIDAKNCALVESGTKNQGVVYRGESVFGMCNIKVPVKEFNKRYSYCALSGFIQLNGNSNLQCEFGYSNTDKSAVFFSTAGTSTLCQYVCVK